MATTALQQETYLPSEAEDVARVYDFLARQEAAGRERLAPQYFLAGAASKDCVKLPADLIRVLRQVVFALQQNHAVTVAPQTTTLTTQQAAELLGVSRPTVIKLLNEHKIPYERTGTHRRILLRDLLAYREGRRAAQYAALEATSMGISDEDDVEVTLRELREARREIAARRQARKAR